MDNEYADLNDIPGNIVIQPYMFEPPQRPNNQESSEESDNGDEDDQRDRRINTFWLVLKNDRVDLHYKFCTTKYCLAILC